MTAAGEAYVPSFLRDEATAERIAAIFRRALARKAARETAAIAQATADDRRAS